MKLLTAAAAILATRRITSLLTEDKITEDLRDRVLDIAPPETHKIGYLFTCRACASVWGGLAAVSLLSLNNKVTRGVTYALALSEATTLIDRGLPRELDL